MGKVYKIFVTVCAVVFIVANHVDNKVVGNAVAICLIIASLGYEILKRKNVNKRENWHIINFL